MAESEIAKKLGKLIDTVDKTLADFAKDLGKVTKAAKDLKESAEKMRPPKTEG